MRAPTIVSYVRRRSLFMRLFFAPTSPGRFNLAKGPAALSRIRRARGLRRAPFSRLGIRMRARQLKSCEQIAIVVKNHWHGFAFHTHPFRGAHLRQQVFAHLHTRHA